MIPPQAQKSAASNLRQVEGPFVSNIIIQTAPTFSRQTKRVTALNQFRYTAEASLSSRHMPCILLLALVLRGSTHGSHQPTVYPPRGYSKIVARAVDLLSHPACEYERSRKSKKNITADGGVFFVGFFFFPSKYKYEVTSKFPAFVFFSFFLLLNFVSNTCTRQPQSSRHT